MRSRLFGLFATLLLMGANESWAEAKAHSTSTSRQYIVYGTEVEVRGAMCDLAERTKANLLQVLDLRDGWKTPLVINLDYPQANFPEVVPARLEFSQIGTGLKLQLNLLVAGDLDGREVQRELLRATLIEMIYRQRTNVAAGSVYATPPDWLIDGLLQLAPGRGSDEAVQLLESMVAADKIPPVEEIVRQKRDQLGPASRKVHDAYAMALAQLLIDSPDGRAKFVTYLTDLPDAPSDPMADLQAHFPLVLGASSGKWWSLSVARLAATDRYQILSTADTSRQLDQLLKVAVSDSEGAVREYPLSDFARFMKRAGSRAALQQLSQEFLLLSTRAHPSYRSVVKECYEVTLLLARGKTKRVHERLARVASYRAVVGVQDRDMDDYLNWFEATQLKTMSGAFSEILKNASDADEALPRRRDPISVYLDSIEASL